MRFDWNDYAALLANADPDTRRRISTAVLDVRRGPPGSGETYFLIPVLPPELAAIGTAEDSDRAYCPAPVKASAAPDRQERSDMSLKSILAELLTVSRARPGKPRRRLLKNGLGIDVIFEEPDRVKLQIHRPPPGPSEKEFYTVLAHLPYDPTDPAPAEIFQHTDGRVYWRTWWCQ